MYMQILGIVFFSSLNHSTHFSLLCPDICVWSWQRATKGVKILTTKQIIVAAFVLVYCMYLCMCACLLDIRVSDLSIFQSELLFQKGICGWVVSLRCFWVLQESHDDNIIVKIVVVSTFSWFFSHLLAHFFYLFIHSVQVKVQSLQLIWTKKRPLTQTNPPEMRILLIGTVISPQQRDAIWNKGREFTHINWQKYLINHTVTELRISISISRIWASIMTFLKLAQAKQWIIESVPYDVISLVEY